MPRKYENENKLNMFTNNRKYKIKNKIEMQNAELKQLTPKNGINTNSKDFERFSEFSGNVRRWWMYGIACRMIASQHVTNRRTQS